MKKSHFSTLLLSCVCAVMPSVTFAESGNTVERNKVENVSGEIDSKPSNNFEELLKKMPKISGYVQTGYFFQSKDVTGKDDNVSTFQAKRFRFILDSKISDMFDIRAQFELFSSSKDARGKATFTVMDAFATAHLLPELHLRVGQYYLPVGFENYDISPATLETVDFSSLCYRMVCRNAITAPGYIDYGRDLGIMAYGDFLPNEAEGFNYLSYNLSYTNGSLPTIADDNKSKDFVGRLTFRPIKNLRIMGSYQYGKYTQKDATGAVLHDNAEMNRVIAGAWYNDPTGLTLRSEWGWMRSSKANVKEHGFYVLAGYHVGKFLPVLRYEMYRDNARILDRMNKDTYLMGVTYQPVKNFKVQANYSLNTYTNDIKKSEMAHTGTGHQVQVMCVANF